MMRLTDEQIDAVDLFCTGGELKIFAFAGAGKTTTLAAMADEAMGPALYLAFNRAIAIDARERFPESTSCSTVHSLAFQALREEFGTRKLTEALTVPDYIEILALEDRPFGAVQLTARAQAALVKSTVERFLHGVNRAPQASDLALTGALARAPAEDCLELIDETVTRARLVWSQMVDSCNPVPLGHDGYLKLWALGAPKLPADHIFLDEAQDTNPLVLDIVRRQDAQIVYVGDPYQRIYGWRGAVDVMTALPAAYSAHLTQSFRFGHAIAEAASWLVASLGETRRIIGNPRVRSTIGRCVPDAVIARTNAGVVDAVLDALMIAERPYVVGGTGDLLRLLVGVEQLKQGCGVGVPELIGFATWGEVVETAACEPGSGLAPLVQLVEEYGEDRLITALAKVATSEAHADLVVTTAHRAKGREWNKVQLRGEFGHAAGLHDGSASLDPAEIRLLYVALTRARRAVDAPPELIEFCGSIAEA